MPIARCPGPPLTRATDLYSRSVSPSPLSPPKHHRPEYGSMPRGNLPSRGTDLYSGQCSPAPHTLRNTTDLSTGLWHGESLCHDMLCGLSSAMPDPTLLEAFASPTDSPFVVEHIAKEFTSLCPMTSHPDFAVVSVRFMPAPASAGGRCVELKSLKLYLQSFRDEGIFYEAVTNRIRDDLAALMEPLWLRVRTDWRGRGGIRSIITADAGTVPPT